MANFLTIAFIALITLSCSEASIDRNFPICGYTCELYTGYLNTGCEYINSTQYYDCICYSEVIIGSMALCIDTYCARGERTHAWNYAHSICGNRDIGTFEEAIAKAGPLSVAPDTFNGSTIIDVPQNLSQVEYDSFYPTARAFYGNMEFGELYGGATMIYWFGLMFISFCWKMTSKILPTLAIRSNRVIAKLRKHFVIPALFNGEHTLPLKLMGIKCALMPTRGEAFILIGFFIINFVCLFVNYRLDNNNIYWPDAKNIQLMRYIADRTGIMAFVQLPVLILFGGRNNFLLWVTGWSFQSFMLYHRWIARVMYVNAVLHSVGYTAYGLSYGKEAFYSYWEDGYLRWGAAATVIGGFIMFQAFYIFRHRWYEIFLALHIVFVATFIVALWYHCVDLGWMEYIYASIAIWIFDRVIRVVRILLFGANAIADMQIIGDIIQMQIAAPLVNYSPHPGYYAYIYIAQLKFWESHPFSLVEVRDGKYVYVAKARKGMTLKLWTYLKQQPEQTARMRVGVEGPYGEKFLVEPFNVVLLIAGGIGISAMIQYAKRLGETKREKQRINLYWIVKSDESLLALAKPMSEIILSNSVDVHIHVTTSTNERFKLSGEKNFSESEEDLTTNSLFADVLQYTRPDVEQLITDVITEANGSVAIAVCGPERLNDTCRRATAANVDIGKKRVEYYEEAFAWA